MRTWWTPNEHGDGDDGNETENDQNQKGDYQHAQTTRRQVAMIMKEKMVIKIEKVAITMKTR